MMSESQFKFLRSIDTPTVCNLIEIVSPERRGAGYTQATALPVSGPARRWSASPRQRRSVPATR
jgi:hypothetical protein